MVMGAVTAAVIINKHGLPVECTWSSRGIPHLPYRGGQQREADETNALPVACKATALKEEPSSRDSNLPKEPFQSNIGQHNYHERWQSRLTQWLLMRLAQNFLRFSAPVSSDLTKSSTQLETLTIGISSCSQELINSSSLYCPAAFKRLTRKSRRLFGTFSSSLYTQLNKASPMSWSKWLQS